MPVQDVRASTLRRAAEILGSEEHLAVHLGITPSHLSLWLRGLGHAPDAVFLRAVDIVLESDRKTAAPERLV